MEYQKVMEDVITRSGLDKSIYYDLRGNHDNFGVPVVDGALDYYSKYSINAQLGRRKNVNSVTIQAMEFSADKTSDKDFFWAFPDFIFSVNTFWEEPKGYISQAFPISLSMWASPCEICSTCTNLPYESNKNCSSGALAVEEFWEWEMGDWRKSRAVRILAVDRGHVSYVDIDFKSGMKNIILMPTFPLDSRFMSRLSSHQNYECQHMLPSSYETIRALVFSTSFILSVVAKVYDSRSGNFELVMEELMRKKAGNSSRGDLYFVPWNYKAFESRSPDRFWLQIEATDMSGRSTLSELRPFSVNGFSSKFSWTWKEFYVMGCQWVNLYYPVLWFALYFLFFILLVPKALLIFSKNQYTYKNFITNKGFINGMAWVLQELSKIPIVYFGSLGYLLYLVLCPWLVGYVLTDGSEKGYMTYKGWVVKSNNGKRDEYIGSPDIIVVVLPHLLFVVSPMILVCTALAAEKGIYREHILSLSGKKEDDYGKRIEGHQNYEYQGNRKAKFYIRDRWIRKILLASCLALLWKHLINCRGLIGAYEMNPIIHFPVYSFSIPLLLASAVYKTGSI
ncbi:hypothetical protein Patl1_23965 [Pistacia atlantica]|uniref:Uncharacterized protein n=1 Tax=Pistacia atlantica TaxID=434234 RepID=A0ACC0ZYR3_9ROSI|nr:hypothetical protein Patl1_23965 [Pistacia atlantica]